LRGRASAKLVIEMKNKIAEIAERWRGDNMYSS
jgi:hypothetical protein